MLKQLKKILTDSRLRIPVFCLLVMISIGVGGAVFWHQTMYHFKTVVPGKLYRSGTLSDLGLEMSSRLYGIKTIVNVRSEDENRQDWYKREKAFTRAHHMNLVDIPMAADTPPTVEQIKKFISVVNDPSMTPVIVHCEMGVIRTGMMVAAYEIEALKEPNEKVLNELPMFGHTFERRPQVRQFILSYTP